MAQNRDRTKTMDTANRERNTAEGEGKKRREGRGEGGARAWLPGRQRRKILRWAHLLKKGSSCANKDVETVWTKFSGLTEGEHNSQTVA